MNGHLDPKVLARFASGAVTGRELLAIDDHLAECEACRTAAASPESISALRAKVSDVLRGAHATYADLEAAVDGKLTAEQRIDLDHHLSLCAACASELEDLRGFRREMLPRRMPAALWRAAAAAIIMALVGAVVAFWPAHPAGVPQENATKNPAPVRVEGVDRTARELTATAPPDLPIQPQLRAVFDHLQSGEIPAAALLAALNPPAGQQRKGDVAADPVELLGPVGIVIAEPRPLFRWKAAGGGPFRVEVYDEDFVLVSASGEVDGEEWRAGHALPRGKILSWQLVGGAPERQVHPASPAPAARFYVIPEPAQSEIDAARHAGRTLDVAILYAREGMSAEAAETFEALAKTSPEREALLEAAKVMRSGAHLPPIRTKAAQ